MSKPYTGPFEYERAGGRILDANGMWCLDLRGWGEMTGTGSGAMGMSGDDAAAAQDKFGEFVAMMLNVHGQTLECVMGETPKEQG